MEAPSYFRPNAHFFAGGGPSIVSTLLRKPQSNRQNNENTNLKQNTTVTFERTETNSTMPSSISEISANRQKENIPNISPKPQNLQIIQENQPVYEKIYVKPQKQQEKAKKETLPLQVSYPQAVIDYQDNTNYTKQSSDEKEKKLSPATLGAMLEAELDHYIKVETEIGQVAEIVGNVQVAEHEQKAAQNIIYTDDNDDTEDMEELARLDEEIMRLEGILAEKLRLKAEKDAEYYSSEYYSDYED